MCEEKGNVALLEWQISQMFGNKPNGQHWVQAINQNRDLVPFINKLKLDAFNFYNSCCMSVASFNVL